MPKPRSLAEIKRDLLRGDGVTGGAGLPVAREGQALAQEFSLPASYFTVQKMAMYEQDAQRVFGCSFAALSAENRKNVINGWIPFEKEVGW